MTRKLDTADFNKIADIQESYRSITAAIAKCTIDEELLLEQLETVRAEKKQAMQDFRDTQLQEQTTVIELREKYGEGEIDVESGTFTAHAAE
jgi:allophanate hydrolase subunit 1